MRPRVPADTAHCAPSAPPPWPGNGACACHTSNAAGHGFSLQVDLDAIEEEFAGLVDYRNKSIFDNNKDGTSATDDGDQV